jgi:hypothetical protein
LRSSTRYIADWTHWLCVRLQLQMIHVTGVIDEHGSQSCELCAMHLATAGNTLPAATRILERLEGPEIIDYCRHVLDADEPAPAGTVVCEAAHGAFAP